MTNENKPKDNFFTRIGKNYFIFLSLWLAVCLLFSKPINTLLNKIGGFLFYYDKSIVYDLVMLLLVIAIYFI